MSYYSPLSLITGLPGTRRKVVLFAYMLSQGGTDRVTALLARGYADAGFDAQFADEYGVHVRQVCKKRCPKRRFRLS